MIKPLIITALLLASCTETIVQPPEKPITGKFSDLQEEETGYVYLFGDIKATECELFISPPEYETHFAPIMEKEEFTAFNVMYRYYGTDGYLLFIRIECDKKYFADHNYLITIN